MSGSELIKVGDRFGVFTPVAVGNDSDSQSNLEAVIAALRKRVGALESENLQLKAQLSAAQIEARTSDDFASAVSHTQTRLADTHNPVSRFAVRDMTIEAQVYVDVIARNSASGSSTPSS